MCFSWRRVAKGAQKGTIFDAFWCMFLNMVIFSKLMTVSNGMLTFARSGVLKMPPKVDKNWCQKTMHSFDELFTKKCSHRLPKVLQKWIKNRSKIDALAHLGPRGPPRSMFDRFLINFGRLLVPKWASNATEIDQKSMIFSHVVPKNIPYDLWSEIRQNIDRRWCDSYTTLVPKVIKKHCM